MLNSDLWKQKIKASQYWELVYTTVYTIHAGVLETITIDGVYGSFTTNSNGTVSHALPFGELTLNGSISGQSFTRTVTKDTTDIYVMPEGALYWYGFDNTKLTGGLGLNQYNYSGVTAKSFTVNTNDIYSSDTSNVMYFHGTKNKIELSKYNSANVTLLGNNENQGLWILSNYSVNGNIVKAAHPSTFNTKTTVSVDISSLKDQYYISAFNSCGGSTRTSRIYAIWLE